MVEQSFPRALQLGVCGEHEGFSEGAVSLFAEDVEWPAALEPVVDLKESHELCSLRREQQED